MLSHNGMDVDLKMAARVRGIDAIFGGHTHDGVPLAVPVANAGGTTLVTNAGSNGKFLGVMDFEVKGGKVADFRYRLLPVFSNLLAPDPAMDALITKVRAPFEAKLAEKLAVTDGLLYRRGNFNGSWDQLVCDALIDVQGAEIAFSPGFRWGTTLLPGETITREMMMDQLAITYPYATVTEMTGETIKTVLEDVADNLFNPDPYYQQGGDMVRVGGMTYTITPGATMGARIGDMRLNGRPIEADKTYKVAGWAPVAEEARSAPGIKPVWDVVELAARPAGPRRAAAPNTPSWWAAATRASRRRGPWPAGRSGACRRPGAALAWLMPGLQWRPTPPCMEIVQASASSATAPTARARARCSRVWPASMRLHRAPAGRLSRGRRKSNTMRPMVDDLSPEDFTALGRYFESRPPQAHAVADPSWHRWAALRARQ